MLGDLDAAREPIAVLWKVYDKEDTCLRFILEARKLVGWSDERLQTIWCAFDHACLQTNDDWNGNGN